MKNKGVDIEKIAKLLTSSAKREEGNLQKIAELESEIATLRAERESNQISFSGEGMQKEASFEGHSDEEMGSVDAGLYTDEPTSGRERLNNFLESLS